jgi:hypothetical protein
MKTAYHKNGIEKIRQPIYQSIGEIVSILCFLIVFVSMVNNLFAQHLPPIDAQWIYNSWGRSPTYTYQEYYLYKCEKDTLFQNIPCVKVNQKYYNTYQSNFNEMRTFYLMEQNDTVFIYNDNTSNFVPVYFFNVQIGNSYISYHFSDAYGNTSMDTFSLKIENIAYENINGTTLKKIFYERGIDAENYYYERIGSPVSFMTPFSHTRILEYGEYTLACYTDSTVQYSNNTINCSNVLNILTFEKVKEKVISIAPNPTNAYIIVKYDTKQILSKNCDMIIYDIHGIEKIRQPIYQNIGEVVINTEALSTGVYYIKLCNTADVAVQKFNIIKQ